MKRAADGDLYRPQSPQNPYGAEAQGLTVRRTCTNGLLDSLMDPVPGGPQTLLDLLTAYFFPRTSPGEYPVLGDEVVAIMQLDNLDMPPSPAMAPACMALLLSLGQARLMVRLAQTCELDYVLDVGNSEAKASVLARIGNGWPSSGMLTLVISNRMPIEGAELLRRFDTSDRPLNLKVIADGRQGQVGAEVLSQVLKTRNCRELTLVGGPHAFDTFDALVGIRAQVIRFATLSTDIPVGQAAWAPYGSALVRIARHAEAHTLHLADRRMPGDIFASLSASRPWACVRTLASLNFFGLPRTGQYRIDRLELHLDLTTGNALPLRPLMQMLWALGTTTLVVLGPLDLAQFAQALEDFAHETPALATLLHRLEACFVLRPGADAERALAQLGRDLRVEQLVHTSVPIPARAGHAPIDAALGNRILGQNLANKARVIERVGGDQSHRDLAWREAVDTISDLLAPSQPVATFVQYLKSPRNTLIDASGVAWVTPESTGAGALVHKLMLLPTYGFHADLLREAVARRLRAFPGETRSMCKALIVSQFPLKQVSRATWSAIAVAHHKRGLYQTLHPGALALAGASSANAIATAPLSAVAAADTPRLIPTPASLKARAASMVEPAGEQGVANLVARMRQRGQIGVYFGPQAAACTAIVELLQTGRAKADELERGRVYVGDELLQVGQMKLLRFMATLGPELTLFGDTPAQAAQLARLALVPAQAGGRYELCIPSTLPDTELQQVLKFADSVPPSALRLSVTATVGTPRDFWPTLATFIRSHDGLHLDLAQHKKRPLPSWHMIEFMEEIGRASLRGFGLANGFEEATARPVCCRRPTRRATSAIGNP
ncbi:MAG: hypothetical protein Q7T87_21975 [Polaromonas sp.]|nr:hypothetical protein [Polaromonas sp.]